MRTKEIERLLALWIKELEKSDKAQNTINQHARSINLFLDYLADNNIKTVKKESIQAYKAFLIENYKTNTVNIRLTGLNKFFKENGLTDFCIKTVRQQRKSSSDNLTLEEYQKLLKACDKLNKPKLKLLMKVLAGTGIRFSELKYITIEGIRDNRGQITVFNKGKERSIAVPYPLCLELEQYAREQNISQGMIFHGRQADKLLDKSYLWRQLQKVAEYAGISNKVSSHSFRHLFARIQLDNGTSVLELADLMGHSSLETTRIYTRSSLDEKQKRLNDTYSQVLCV